jgi:hypothetical protein
MALAIKLDGLVRGGVVRDYAALARLGHVSRARATKYDLWGGANHRYLAVDHDNLQPLNGL